MTSLARAIFWSVLFLLVVAAPVPIGSVNTEWSMLVAAASMVLGAGLLVAGLKRGLGLSRFRTLAPLCFFTLWIGLQLIPLPRGLVGFLSPGRVSDLTARAGDAFLPLTVYPGVTLEKVLLHFGLLLLLLGLSTVRSRAPFRILALAGFLHAALAAVLMVTGGTGSDRVVWLYELPEVLTPFGTYVNKNHFGGLMIIGIGAALAVMLRRWFYAYQKVRDFGWRGGLSALAGRGFFRLLAPLVAVLSMLLTVFASGSRGAAAAIGLALILVPIVVSRARGRVRIWPAAVATGVLCGVALLATMGRSTSVLERFLPEGNFMNRPRLWKEAMRMTLEFPLCGTGIGTFTYVFPRYQSFAPDREFTHAEGDWVQNVAETGFVGGLALLVFAILLWRRMIRALKAPTRTRAIVIGGGIGIAGIALHGLVDVSLHIPSNMLAVTVLLGGLLGLTAPPEGTGCAEQP